MIEFLPAPEDTVAVLVEDRVANADLEALIDRIEAALARGAPVHVYTEVRGLGSIELAGFPAAMQRGLPLLGRLKDFGRVAVVADQAWLRGLTRVESAVLPGISYRVFEPAQRDEAMRWVLGEDS